MYNISEISKNISLQKFPAIRYYLKPNNINDALITDLVKYCIVQKFDGRKFGFDEWLVIHQSFPTKLNASPL